MEYSNFQDSPAKRRHWDEVGTDQLAASHGGVPVRADAGGGPQHCAQRRKRLESREQGPREARNLDYWWAKLRGDEKKAGEVGR